MKHCPACNFSFPDFHKVCDFDGTELVADQERPTLVKPSGSKSLFRRVLQSPVLWAAVLLMFVLSSAFLVALLDPSSQLEPGAKVEPSRSSLGTPPARVADATAAKHQTAAKHSSGTPRFKSTNSSRRTRTITSRSVAKSAPRTSSARSQNHEIARRGSDRNGETKASGQVHEEKEPKITAMLKTTWRVLKKPFKF